MKKFILAIVLSAVVVPSAFAMTAFKSGEYRDSMGNTHCLYNSMGQTYELEIGIGICPLSINV